MRSQRGLALCCSGRHCSSIKGDAASAQQVAQLKGDMDAIEQANIQKQCGIEFKRPAPG